MEIIHEEIWKIIEPYIDEDIGSIDDIEQTLQDLKKNYPEYYEQVKILLEERDSATSYFSELSENIHSAVQEETYPPGYQIGVFTIVKLISSGGMSHVYQARRTDGEYDQQVAIKVLKESIHNKPLKEQFQREKQILADLNHPNIASIFDSGLTEQGRPYFIMEYIDGQPITQYCDEHHLPITERLELFSRVCQTVNYAHQNLIIHKDLKPNNIFVDKNGYLKLMDFGIAQITQEAQRDKQASIHAFTPRYASPEQKQGNKITTLSDVYQLGLLLTKLLTGVHWNQIDSGIQNNRFHPDFLQVSKKEVQQILKKRDIPSEKQFKTVLAGDLQSIMIAALDPDPDQRYHTVHEIENDIQFYFANQPLKARSHHFNYLFSKFIKRNHAKIKIAIFFILVMTGITVNYTIQLANQKDEANKNAALAKSEANRAQSVTNYLISIFSLGDPYINSVKTISVDQLLEKGYHRLEKATSLDPDTRADILLTMSDVFMENAEYDKSLEAIQRAHFLKDSLKPSNHQDLSDVYSQYASFYKTQSQLDTAIQFIQKALAIDSLYLADHPIDYTYDLEKLGKLYALKTDYDKALPIYKQVIRRMNQENDFNKEIKIASVESTLGEIYFKTGKFDSSKKYLIRSWKVHNNMQDTTNAYLLHDLSKIAQLYLELEELDSAEYFIRESIRKTSHVFGDSSVELVHKYSIASSVYQMKNDFENSLFYAEKAYEIASGNFGPNHIRSAYRLNTIGLTYNHFGLYKKAEAYFRQSLQIKEQNYPQYQRSISISQYNLAETLLKQRKTDEAVKQFKQVYATEKELYPGDHPNLALTLTKLGRSLLDMGALEEAFPLLDRAYQIIEKKFDTIHSRKAECAMALAEYHLKKQKWTQASHFAEQGMIIFEKLYGLNHWKVEYTSALKTLAKAGKLKNTDPTKQLEKTIISMRNQPYAEEYYINQLILYAKELKSNLQLNAPA